MAVAFIKVIIVIVIYHWVKAIEVIVVTIIIIIKIIIRKQDWLMIVELMFVNSSILIATIVANLIVEFASKAITNWESNMFTIIIAIVKEDSLEDQLLEFKSSLWQWQIIKIKPIAAITVIITIVATNFKAIVVTTVTIAELINDFTLIKK